MFSQLMLLTFAVTVVCCSTSEQLELDIHPARVGASRRPESSSAVEDGGGGGRVRRPLQDPRHYYQSELYLREALAREDAARDHMSAVYPGLAARGRRRGTADRSATYRRLSNSVTEYDDDEDETRRRCVRCPAERTVVARAGEAAALLQPPRLRRCDGSATTGGDARFLRKYGPAVGSLLPPGEHVVVGSLLYEGQFVRQCRWRIHIVSQRCPLPPALHASCSGAGARCDLTCADPTLQLLGAHQLHCGRDLRWSGSLPVCRARTWCQAPVPPDNGHLRCQSAAGAAAAAGGAARLAEGSRCRARCEPGWRAAPRGSAVCRRGRWTHALACSPLGRPRAPLRTAAASRQ